MRVLHLINGLGTGGAERSLAEMLPLLQQGGVDSTVACQHHRPRGVHNQVVDAGFRVEVVGESLPVAARRIWRLVREIRPDIVHTTLFEADVLGRSTTIGSGARILTSLVNTTYDGMRVADSSIDPRKVALVKAADRITAQLRNDHFHAITQAVKESAVRHLNIAPERITVVERGRETARLGSITDERRAAARAALGLAPGVDVLVNVGRQEASKGQSDLLEAMALLRRRRPDVVLLQAGREGNATAGLESLVEDLTLGDSVRFLGHREDIAEVLAAADVFVFPSVYEGLGGSVLEAMAMRLPIIVSDIAPLVDVVEHGTGALVVPVRDPEGLAAGMETMLVDREGAERLAGQAEEIFHRRFSLGRSVEGMLGIYRRMLAA